MANIAFTYDDNAVREDLLDVLTNLSPTDYQLVSGLGTGESNSTLHEWLIDTLNSVKTNAHVEGADATFHNLTNPTRLFNYTQIFKQGYKVSDTERSVNAAAFNDRYAYEAEKAMRQAKNDMEYAVLRGSLACGTGSAARQMRGIKNSLSLVTSQSAVSMTEAMLNNHLNDTWDQGVHVNSLYGDMYIKSKISGFTAGSTKFTKVEDRRLINVVDVYEADASNTPIRLFAHRHMTVSGDAGHDVLGIDEDMFKIDYLRKPFTRELAKTGDHTRGEFVCEATMRNMHYNAGFLAKQYL